MTAENQKKRMRIPSSNTDYTKEAESVSNGDGGAVAEAFVIQNQEELETNAVSEEESVYPMNTIKTERGFYTIYELKRKFEKDPPQIVLDSDFQRNSVWKPQQKRELIESVLMGLPLPIFYFNQDRTGRLIVIDGRQRLTAFFEFMDEKNGFALDHLTILTDLNKMKFKNLETSLKTKIEDYQIIAHVIPPSTPDKIKFDIFDRVNRSGTKLNKQEIRNALYQGPATKLLLELSRREEFAEATEKVFEKETRMKDRYILLRFIAFYLYYQGAFAGDSAPYQYAGDIDEFLGRAMEYLNRCPAEQLERIRGTVLASLRKASYYLGLNAFRLVDVQPDGSVKRYPTNINIFETLMLAMTELPEQDASIRPFVRASVDRMKHSDAFLDSLNNHRDSSVKIEARYQMMKDLVREIEAASAADEGGASRD